MRFAWVSPVFVSRGFHALVSRACLAVALTSLIAVPCFSVEAGGSSAANNNNEAKRQAATAQLERAEEQRQTLSEKPANKRTLAEYKQVVNTYRRVYLITPRAPEVPEALSVVGELYLEMGDRFGRSYYQSAGDSYRFLIREYPASKLSQDAMLKIAAVEK